MDTDRDVAGMQIIADIQGNGNIHSERALQEFREIKTSVLQQRSQRQRTYKDMWKFYKKRVLIAMSSQALAQLVSDQSEISL